LRRRAAIGMQPAQRGDEGDQEAGRVVVVCVERQPGQGNG
jgi:hypothetical protein